MTRNNRII